MALLVASIYIACSIESKHNFCGMSERVSETLLWVSMDADACYQLSGRSMHAKV